MRPWCASTHWAMGLPGSTRPPCSGETSSWPRPPGIGARAGTSRPGPPSAPAAGATSAAADIGRSDPAVHHALAELEHAELEMELYSQGNIEPSLQRGLQAVARALAVAPDHYESRVLEARLHRRLTEHHAARGDGGPGTPPEGARRRAGGLGVQPRTARGAAGAGLALPAVGPVPPEGQPGSLRSAPEGRRAPRGNRPGGSGRRCPAAPRAHLQVRGRSTSIRAAWTHCPCSAGRSTPTAWPSGWTRASCTPGSTS